MFEMLLSVISRNTAVEEEEISFESRLREDLEMDASDLYMLRYDLERVLETEISEEEMDALATVMDVLKMAQSHA